MKRTVELDSRQTYILALALLRFADDQHDKSLSDDTGTFALKRDQTNDLLAHILNAPKE